jgi:hypothetical protein|tara:strand:- start:3 stop:500 length:498 start_codon:yes stop_codon:yes gene_type:complete
MNKRKQKQIRELIQNVLKKINMYSLEAENLVFGTGLIESNYDYLKQWNNGVARSWWQIEPGMTGAMDTIENYLHYRKNLLGKCAIAAKVAPFYFRKGVEENEVRDMLETNIAYALIMCRLKYRRVPKKLPKTVEGMAHYWKKYFNSDLGKGDPEEFIEKYKMTQK